MRQFFISTQNRVALLLCLLLFTQFYQTHSQSSQMWWVNTRGGANGLGSISSMMTNGANYQEINGSTLNPVGKLTKGNNGKIYGASFSGGQNNLGVLFEIDPTNVYRVKHNFDSTITGLSPLSSTWLVADQYFNPSAGKLYGVSRSDGGRGANDLGTFFEFNTTNGVVSKLLDRSFDRFILSFMQARNGKFYGIAGLGNSNLSIFEYDINTNTYTKKLQLPPVGVVPIAFM
jgi:hypothetical protein